MKVYIAKTVSPAALEKIEALVRQVCATSPACLGPTFQIILSDFTHIDLDRYPVGRLLADIQSIIERNP